MKKLLLIVMSSACVTTVFAVPLPQNGLSQIGATALIDVSSDSTAASSPPDSLPLLGSATVSTLEDNAFAFGSADVGFLSVGAQADSTAQNAFATSFGEYSANFLAPGSPFLLTFFFDASATAAGLDSLAEIVLAYSLFGDSNTLLDGEIRVSSISDTKTLQQPFSQTFSLPLNTFTEFNLLLLNSASATLGSAFNLASVQYEISPVQAVPEPSMTALLGIGALMLFLVPRRKTQRRCVGV